jgi:hypothetical protein
VGTDPTNWDSDGDGLNDGHEVAARSDPNNPDTDGDGLLDGQEVQKNDHDWCYTNTDPLKVDTDGDGVGDYYDDEDGDTLLNGEEWQYDSDVKYSVPQPKAGLPIGWTDPQDGDTDGDTVLDGYEEYGNPNNNDKTSDPIKPDTDLDRLRDDIDPRPYIKDYLPFSRVRGNAGNGGPMFPSLVTKGVPFNVEGHIEYNTTGYTGPGTGNWRRIDTPMKVQVWIDQGGELIPISDEVITGNYGNFKISCTIGDNVKAGNAVLVITTTIHQKVSYLPVLWDEIAQNHIL